MPTNELTQLVFTLSALGMLLLGLHHLKAYLLHILRG